MKAQTAVEWIEGYLKKFNHIEDSLSLRMAFKKAKEMERQQIIHAFRNGYLCHSKKGEQYYNEKFGK